MAGASPRSLGEHLGISHDTILIAFKEAGLPARTTAEAGVTRKERLDAELAPRIVKTFKRTRSIRDTAHATGTSYERVRRLLAEAAIRPDAYRPWRVGKLGGPERLSAEDALAILRRAARSAGGGLTVKRYRELATVRRSSSGSKWPLSPDTLLKALGASRWNDALSLAGLSTQPSSGTRGRKRDREWKSLRQLTKKLGRAPTMPEYDATRGPGMLSAQALTKRSGRWRDALEAAGIKAPW